LQTRRLAGQNAVVTGASSGIGRAIAVAFAREGAAGLVLGFCRNADGARAAAEEVLAEGGVAHVIQADLSGEKGVAELTAEAFSSLGRVDVWVNNAGADLLTGEGARLSDAAKLELALGVDVRGTMLCSWHAAERMQKQGAGVILNMAWDRVLTGAPGREAEVYAAAKGAVLAFSKSLARSVAPEVRVNVLCPGWIATAYADGLPETKRRHVADATPLRRWGTPEDVARAAVFLASGDSSFMTGVTLLVNGGVVM
jgi:3-oxoacyl-[acyl-carrier protein] reductase